MLKNKYKNYWKCIRIKRAIYFFVSLFYLSPKINPILDKYLPPIFLDWGTFFRIRVSIQTLKCPNIIFPRSIQFSPKNERLNPLKRQCSKMVRLLRGRWRTMIIDLEILGAGDAIAGFPYRRDSRQFSRTDRVPHTLSFLSAIVSRTAFSRHYRPRLLACCSRFVFRGFFCYFIARQTVLAYDRFRDVWKKLSSGSRKSSLSAPRYRKPVSEFAHPCIAGDGIFSATLGRSGIRNRSRI